MNQILNHTSEQSPTQPRSSGDCKQAPGIIVPAVDLKRCEGKGDCLVVCPERAITLVRAA